jgi:hypothetical protein
MAPFPGWAMHLDAWRTSEPLAPDFAGAWQRRLNACRRADFSMSAAYLAWQAGHGETARAVLLDDAERRGAMVLRESGRELVSGWPWRWQAVIEDADPADPAGMTAGDAAWFFHGAVRLAGHHRLRVYAPHGHHGSLAAFPAGGTMLMDLAHATDDGLFARMEHAKRRRVRKCVRQGYEVREDRSVEAERAFAGVTNDTHERRHHLQMPALASSPGPCERWRNWELPWHRLFVVVRDGTIVAGLGVGVLPGGAVDARASGSTEAALRDGANVLAQWEVLRRSRLDGYTWFNFGGMTTFKREFGGVAVPVHCRTGGGLEWLAPNVIEGCVRRALVWRAAHTGQRAIALLS